MILNKLGVGKAYTLEVQPLNSATQTTWQFPDIPFLREKYITAISVSSNSYGITSGKNNIGSLMSSVATYSSFLTLVDNTGKQFIQNMPLDELLLQSAINVTGVTPYLKSYNTNGLLNFKPINIVWTKCYIYFPVATALSNYCCQFNVYYQDQK
jgi:hypothetical protein